MRRFRGVASSSGIYGIFTASSQKPVLFEPCQGAGLIEALLAHNERQHSPALFGLEVAPGAGVKLEPETSPYDPSAIPLRNDLTALREGARIQRARSKRNLPVAGVNR